jgi:hypothetical protein
LPETQQATSSHQQGSITGMCKCVVAPAAPA